MQEAPYGVFVEATDEISGGGGIGNGSRTERVQERRIVAPDLDILQDRAATEHVAGDVENVIRVLVRARHFQGSQVLVECAYQPPTAPRRAA